MRIIYEHWKYIFRNLWFVLPFAVIPAIFLALSFDASAIQNFLQKFFGGDSTLTFSQVFRAWTLFRFDSALGAVYSICAFICSVFFLSLLLSFVEKHMRIGKRTLSGVFSQLGDQILSVVGITALYLVIYELWALVLSALLYTVSAISSLAAVVLLGIFIALLFFAVILYLVTVFYLWLPCIQITGMRAYNALLYSYRLMVGMRGKLLLSLLMSLLPAFLVLWGCAFLPAPAPSLIAFVLILFLALSFAVRMETFYFEADKLDREDLLRSYREL